MARNKISRRSAKDDSATVPLQHQFELPVDCKDDVETISKPASLHDRDVMHKVQGVMRPVTCFARYTVRFGVTRSGRNT